MLRAVHDARFPSFMSILAIFYLTSCSSDDCPTTPGSGGSRHSLSSTVLAPQPTPAYYQDIYAAGTQDVFILAEAGAVLRRQGTAWTTYDTGIVGYAGGMWGT
ncbi:MAG: hypothetical protein GY838_01425 [bacterium]|nr:hypothetical protein [bacterium]